ncbi:c-type cytochrome [Azohydromonas australica]|uniref:c-type cytochrome n=1 Tax=Azohydromonas australica TaxID=364039 RepID=UPI000421714B|nr:c-type cytochrome [Azohydromonas australica]
MPSSALRPLSLLCALALAGWSCAAPAAGNADAGQRTFKRCASCHQVGPSARGGFGPHLNALFGRQAGATPDFNYSAAMKASGIFWTESTLRAFLKSPDATVPGNKMRFWGLGDDGQIDDLLAYLRRFQP